MCIYKQQRKTERDYRIVSGGVSNNYEDIWKTHLTMIFMMVVIVVVYVNVVCVLL